MITPRPQFLEAPDFWITEWTDVNRFLDNVAGGRVRTIGESQGGHPIRAVFYGDKEPVEHQTSRFSAQLAGHMEDFFEPDQRRRPVILVISTIHGGEVEGCAASLNLCSLVETGTDLRGRSWTSLRQAAETMRLVVVPVAQPDGRIRSAVRHLVGATMEELVYYCQGEPKNPGAEPVDWNWFLRHHPVPVDDMEFLGGYFNDAGVNIDLDDFFSSKKAPETEALLDLARDEIPDCVVVLHTYDHRIRLDSGVTRSLRSRHATVAAASKAELRRHAALSARVTAALGTIQPSSVVIAPYAWGQSLLFATEPFRVATVPLPPGTSRHGRR